MNLSHADSVERILDEPVKARLAYLQTLKTEIKLGISEEIDRHDKIARSINYDLGRPIIFLFNKTEQKMAKKIVEQAPEPVVVPKKKGGKTTADLMGEEKPVKSRVATAADLMGTGNGAPKKKAVVAAQAAPVGGQKEIISALAEKGKDIREIHEETGIKINNVRWYFSKLGLREVVEKAQAAQAKQAKKAARASA